MVRLLLQEHKYRAISGSVLLIGRQTIPLTIEQAKALVTEENIAIRPEAMPKLDQRTRAGKEKGYIADTSLFDLISDASVQALDISDYEGAEVIVDLNGSIPHHLEGQFDFIYNGSCLDNIFDPATSLKNMTKLLKPGGRIVHIEHATQVYGPYLMYSPDWFYDYYLINGFADCKVHLGFFHHLDDAWAIYNWDPYVGKEKPRVVWKANYPEKRDFVVLTIAERGEHSSHDCSPVQFQYRHGDEIQVYIDGAEKFSRSRRPRLKGRASLRDPSTLVAGDTAAGTAEQKARRVRRAMNAKRARRAQRIERVFGALGRFLAGKKPRRSDPVPIQPPFTFCGYFE